MLRGSVGGAGWSGVGVGKPGFFSGAMPLASLEAVDPGLAEIDRFVGLEVVGVQAPL